VVGFTAGAALLIAGNQVRNFFGVEIERGLLLHEILLAFWAQVEAINPYVTAVALATLLAGVLIKRFVPRIPYMIAAMLVGSAVGVGLNAVLGADYTGISTIGALPASLPPLSTPDFSLEAFQALAPAALAVTLLALTEAVSIARSIAVRSGQHIDGNREFVGQGLSNLAGSFFSAYVATGSFNRSGVNYQAGARTPLAAVFAGVLLMAIVPLVAPLAVYLPNAAMAGLLMLVAWGLIDFHHAAQIFRASRSEFAVLAVTFAATLLLELEFAILLGVFISLVVYLSRTSRPQIRVRVPDPRRGPKRPFATDPVLPECPQYKIVRIDGSLFFGAVPYVAEKLREYREQAPDQKHMLIVATGMNFLDVAGADFLAREAKGYRDRGGALYFYRVKEGVCEPLKRGNYVQAIGPENMFETKTEAIAAIVPRLDGNICARCRKRIFKECASQPGAELEPEPLPPLAAGEGLSGRGAPNACA
jgi:SulP family sulfate permease